MNSFNMKNTSLDLELVLDIEILQDICCMILVELYFVNHVYGVFIVYIHFCGILFSFYVSKVWRYVSMSVFLLVLSLFDQYSSMVHLFHSYNGCD